MRTHPPAFAPSELLGAERDRTLVAGAVVVVAAGCAALLARPWYLPSPASTPVLVALFAALGAAGLAWRLPARPTFDAVPNRRVASVALLAGLVAFGAVRLLAGAPPASTAMAAALVLNALAAVCEELFFRRLVYGLLAPRGVGVAIVGSAALFAAVHVTVWGVGVLPLDLAAGLLLSWQRAASGRWWVPGITHVTANVLAFL